MRRAILWLDENKAHLLGALILLGFTTFVVSIVRDPHAKAPLGPLLWSSFLLVVKWAVVGIVAIYLVALIATGWEGLVGWAKSPTKVKPAPTPWVPIEKATPIPDPFLAAAQREVNEIAPGDA